MKSSVPATRRIALSCVAQAADEPLRPPCSMLGSYQVQLNELCHGSCSDGMDSSRDVLGIEVPTLP